MSKLSVTGAGAPTSPQPQTSPRRLGLTTADWAFVALLVLGAVIVVVETRGMTFFGDEWDFVVARRGLSAQTLLRPHGPHLSLVPIIVWKVLLAIFGGGSYLPFRLLAAFDIVVVAAALGVACRDRWGPWWGLAPVLLLVTLGPGAITLLWPFQDGYALSMGFGVVALVALDRGGRFADPIACVCLLVSLASASQGIGFTVGVAFMLVLIGNWRRRSWVVLVPAILYVLWYAKYGHQYSETQLSLWGTTLSYCMQALAATAGTLAGLSSVSPQTGSLDLTFGVPIAVALMAALAVSAWRGWRPRAIFWGSAVSLVVVWIAASLSNNGDRLPGEPRYVSSDAMLLLICLCVALPRPRLARNGVIVACIVLAVIALTNAKQYGPQHTQFDSGSQQQRAELGGLELMRGIVSPTYDPGVVDPNLVNITAAPFYDAASSFGLREDTPAQIAAQPEAVREEVDRVLAPNELSLAPSVSASAHGASGLTVLSGAPGHARGCLVVGAAALVLDARPGTITITTGQYASAVTAARFAATPIYGVGTVPAAGSATLTVRRDADPARPWQFTLTGTGARVCA